jgi:hypothetical protein
VTLHVLRVPTRVLSQRPDGEPRWCFVCRKRVEFMLTVHTPTDPLSYYGPHADIKCEHGHLNGDCFPGTYREWGDE